MSEQESSSLELFQRAKRKKTKSSREKNKIKPFIFYSEHTFNKSYATHNRKVGRKRSFSTKSREKTAKSREKIVALLAQDGTLSAVALAAKIGISAKAIEKHLANLKAAGIIERIGPAKGGYWKVR